VTTTVASIVEVNPEKPEEPILLRALELLRGGGVLAFPTDTLYGIGCALGQTAAAERIQNLRGIDTSKRPFTLMLPDIGELPHYAEVNEPAYRVLTRIFPGPYCAELVGTKRWASCRGWSPGPPSACASPRAPFAKSCSGAWPAR
jgi:tRNA threonylcarbamoyl adenosine modification protein (Sua5/YciO/YrdC/YwlC family)